MALEPIRVSPGGRYFETLSGDPFLFLGANDAVAWPGLNPIFRRRDLAAAEAYLGNLADNGINILRVMLEYAHTDGRYFERPAGRYNPLMIRMWDEIFRICENVGMRIMLAPYDNFWLAVRWPKHPLSVQNGGPAANPQAFFTDEATITSTIRRMEFAVERWGGSPAFAAWDLFNEIHPHYGGTPEQQSTVIGRISEAVREAEEKFHGWTRPQTVSIFGPRPKGCYEDLIFRHPHLDFASTHIYSTGSIDYPVETAAPAASMARWTKYALERMPANRPFTDTEHGPIHLFNDHKIMLDEDFDEEYERHMMWAHLASGGAGCGMRWPARNPHILTTGMRRAIGGMANFVRLFSWRHFQPKNIASAVKLEPAQGREVYRFGVGDEEQALIWLLRRPPRGHRGILNFPSPSEGTQLTLRGLAEGIRLVTFWDTRDGREVARTCAAVQGGKLSVPLPPWTNDIAVAVTPG